MRGFECFGKPQKIIPIISRGKGKGILYLLEYYARSDAVLTSEYELRVMRRSRRNLLDILADITMIYVD